MLRTSSAFLAACRGEPVARTPVWFMRQAGRSLPEYRERKGTTSILDAVRIPELAAEITLQPVRRYGVDAAILFSDIVVPVAAIGLGVEIVAGRGPVLAEPLRTAGDLARLRPLEAETDLPYVTETVRILKKELSVPLVGFAGAPFTVASYLIEGGPTRDFLRTKTLMHREPALFQALLGRLADIALSFLRAQVTAGVDAVQLFDSWAGALSRSDYERYVLPASRRVLDGLSDLDVPRIHFGVGTGELLDLMADAGADVMGVDWRTPLDRAAAHIGRPLPLQGNLDPALCVAGFDAAAPAAREILEKGSALSGHIFNLGHGVHQETDPGVLAAIVDLVHAESTRA